MRVFILSTGRCGSSSFIKACNHITNYSAGHETKVRKLGNERFNYPIQHIEADNRLSWHLGELNKLFGDDPFYVHLKRNRDKVAKSFSRRLFTPTSIMDSYAEGIKMMPAEELSAPERLQMSYDYIDTVNANIQYFLEDKSKKMVINLESIKEDFPEFWDRIEAQGNLDKALKEFSVSHNASKRRKFNYPMRVKLLAKREWFHFLMCLKKA
jgi:hypothetical protein